MIAKSFKKDDNTEILVTYYFNKDNIQKYNAIKLTNDQNSEFHSELDFESASEIFDIWVESLDE